MQKGYLMYLYAGLILTSILVILTKGKPSLVRRKLLLGLLIFSLTAPAATLVSCKSGEKKVVQKDVWQTEGWIDSDTYRIFAVGVPNTKLTNKMHRQESAKRSAVYQAQYNLIEKFRPRTNESCAGMASYESVSISMSRELAGIIKSGWIVESRFDEEDNCDIIYEIKGKGLKKMVQEYSGRPQ